MPATDVPARRPGTSRTPRASSARGADGLPREDLAAAGLTVAALAGGAVALGGYLTPGAAVAAAAAALGCAWLLVRSVALATTALLVALFLRQVPEATTLPVQPSTLGLAAVLLALAVGVVTGSVPRPRLGTVHVLMAAFLAWNVLSVLTTHALPAVDAATGEEVSVRSVVQIAVAVPFLLYLVGAAATGDGWRTVQRGVLSVAGYSALVSILQFTGPYRLIWPHYIVDSPGWHGVRAVGVVNQPVENGLILVVGIVVAVHELTRRGAATGGRVAAAAVALPCLAAVWLTHTRAVYLALAVVVLLGAVAVPRMRRVLVTVLVLAAVFLAVNWSSFVSDDRAVGGVGSVREVEDRLNLDATALWAIGEEPVTGWGVGRFAEMNSQHHRQWSEQTDWRRGYGDVAHETALGIGAELGVVGLAVWVALVARIGWVLVRAIRREPDGAAREPAEVALLVLAAWLVVATTVDVRFFAFGGALVMLLLGRGAARHDRPVTQGAG